MEMVLPRSWKEEFERAAALDREEILYREKMKRFEARERERREEVRIHDRKVERDAMATFQAALAPARDVIAFRHQLDDYDARTVEALMDNREAFAQLREKMDRMLGKAHVLPDGRRVFKSEDGQRVFDEHGQQLSLDTIDPNSIDDKKPKWEPFKALLDNATRLDAEQKELLDYQAKLDAARERLDKGEITNGELDQIRTDLATSMPDAVREKLGLEKPKAEVAAHAAAKTQAPPNDMDALMRQTGLATPSGP